MNGLLRKYSYARVYMDDVVVFSITLNKHLMHFKNVFKLFEKWNIIFKKSKTYLEYFSISLLRQKVNSFELITIVAKLKVITDLSFTKILKQLKIYFEMIDYLRNYIFYYAQKAEALNKRKIELLKKSSVKSTIKKNFKRKILMKNSNEKKLNSYEQLQIDFNRTS